MMEYLLGAMLLVAWFIIVAVVKTNRNEMLQLQIDNSKFLDELKGLKQELLLTQEELGKERDKSREILSSKKSSETKLGQISEQVVPFLENCPYDPQSLRFLGSPVDYIHFNFEDGEIHIIEVKSGNSKPSLRQKMIKNIIKAGRVYYAEIRINEKGVKHRKFDNIELSTTVEKEEN